MKRLILLVAGVSLVFTGTVLAYHHATMVAEKGSSDTHLIDSKGMTLYWFTKDSKEMSVCMGGCVEKWPIYYHAKHDPLPGTTVADLGEITRADGKKQTTFRGYPLYYFFKDKVVGDTKGQGVKGVWYTIDPKNFKKD